MDSSARRQDNGVGIAKKDQAKIFERFQQAGNTLTDKPQGTGLGLPISRQILHRFGGDIWVESELGEGATFSFRILLAARNVPETSALLSDASQVSRFASTPAYAELRRHPLPPSASLLICGPSC